MLLQGSPPAGAYHHGVRTFAQRGLPPHIARRAAALLETPLRFYGRGRVARFDPYAHPRNLIGQFADKIDALSPGQSITLPDDTRVQRDADRTFRVVRNRRIASGYQSSAAAAFDALRRSARSTTSTSALGGTRSFSSPMEAMPVPVATQFSEMSDVDLVRHLTAARADKATAHRSSNRYQRRRIQPTETAVRALGYQLRQRSLPEPVTATVGPPQPAGGPAPTAEASRWLEQHLPVGSHISGTRIVDHGVNGDYVWVKGDDNRVWSIKLSGSGGVLTSEISPGVPSYDSTNVQVRSTGFHGTSYTAPAMAQHLAAATNGRYTQVGGSVAIDQMTTPPLTHPPMRGGPTPEPEQLALDIAPPEVPEVQLTPPPTVSQYGSHGVVSVARAQAVVNDLHGFEADGYTASVSAVTRNGFRGEILDPDGEPVGDFNRTFETDQRVYHASFSIVEDHRGSGFGTKFIDHAFATYKRHGFSEVSVSTANIGRYQWAKQGFDFSTDSTRASVFSHIREVARSNPGSYWFDDIPEPQRAAAEALVSELARQIDEGQVTTAGQIAAFGRRSTWDTTVHTRRSGTKTFKNWAGKWLMLGGPGWAGIKQL
jgi:GNAT superfamily N-acetyltransferase